MAQPAAPAASPSPSPAPAPTAAPESADAPPPSGRFETHSPVRLYGLLAAGSHTGLLTLTLADCTVSVHFRKGNPEFIDSSSPEDALGTSLIQARLVTEEQLRQAEAAKERFGGELLGALFGLGLLQPATAFTQLGHRAQAILLKGLRADAGSFTYEPKELPAHKAMPLGNRWAVLTDLVRRIPPAELRRRLQPVEELPVMKSGGRVATSDLRLTPHEVRALSVIDGVRSLVQLLTDLPQDAEHLVRLVFLLKELDAVSFAAVPQRATPPPPQPQAAASQASPSPSTPPQAAAPQAAAPPPPAATQAPRPASAPTSPRPAAPAPAAAPKPAAPAAAPASAPSTDELPALRELAAKLKEQNHFERLGLGPDTHGPAVKIAYFKLAKQYHPDTLPHGAPPELEKLKADIFAYIGDAYRTLSDDKSRAAYIEELQHGGGDGQEVDVEAILKAEELFRKSGLYIKARKFPEAVALLDEAIQLNPEEAEFYAWRGYARFFTYPDKRTGQAEAFRDLNLCLKKNDKVAVAHYYLGVIAKACGDGKGALKHFQKAVELQPNHIEAQREIRLASQRK